MFMVYTFLGCLIFLLNVTPKKVASKTTSHPPPADPAGQQPPDPLQPSQGQLVGRQHQPGLTTPPLGSLRVMLRGSLNSPSSVASRGRSKPRRLRCPPCPGQPAPYIYFLLSTFQIGWPASGTQIGDIRLFRISILCWDEQNIEALSTIFSHGGTIITINQSLINHQS